MVGGVYATVFPDKIHRLIIDGHMGPDPDMESFATWVGESTEAAWTGLAEACDSSLMGGTSLNQSCPAAPGASTKVHDIMMHATTPHKRRAALLFQSAMAMAFFIPGHCTFELMQCLQDLHVSKDDPDFKAPDVCFFFPTQVSPQFPTGCLPLHSPGREEMNSLLGSSLMFPKLQVQDENPSWQGSSTTGVIASVLGMDYAGRFTEQRFIEWWRRTRKVQPLGVSRSLSLSVEAAVWPALARPQPAVGDANVAPLIIGNLYDHQTPYHNAQKMGRSFPSGRMLTWQGYGHGLQIPNITDVVRRYEEEVDAGVQVTYTNDVAKLLCVKMALHYLKSGELPRDTVCKAASPAVTTPPALTTPQSMVITETFVV